LNKNYNILEETQYFIYGKIIAYDNYYMHSIGFRESKEYLGWKKLLHHFYEPFSVVEHYSKNIL